MFLARAGKKLLLELGNASRSLKEELNLKEKVFFVSRCC
jgi:hypothetical protein